MWLSHRWGVVAVPGGRRKHGGLMPKLGGIPIFFAFAVGALLIFQIFPINQDSGDFKLITGVLIGLSVVFVGGLLDDFFDLPWWGQYAVQVIATIIAIRYDVIFGVFTNPVSDSAIDLTEILPVFIVPLITLVWVSGMMNTVNWLDGLDGLAAGVGTIAALLFAWHSYSLQQFAVAAFPLALAGALMGFLVFNFSPAKIFLGSAGAYLIGFSLATLSLITPAKIATALLVMAIPIIDVAWQIFDRIRRKQSPFSGDRGHLHFRLSDDGLPTQLIVLGYYAASAVFGIVAIFAPGLWKLVLLLALTVVVLGTLRWLSN
ncbi:MAG: UDP-GlcNAc:undecaprenyl-phosphate GlcNAc-1-phosphate transferase, partial [Cellvibrionaceae bacterium]